jgi:hypothetical protein
MNTFTVTLDKRILDQAFRTFIQRGLHDMYLSQSKTYVAVQGVQKVCVWLQQ